LGYFLRHAWPRRSQCRKPEWNARKKTHATARKTTLLNQARLISRSFRFALKIAAILCELPTAILSKEFGSVDRPP
jgi:hypothetical protein